MSSQHAGSSSSRRTFLKATTAAAVTAACGPVILGAEDKAGSKTPVIGSGEHTYECHHGWG
ncbi:twin-arginine translocation signal domain-containing protein, partial [Salmonella sp. SAL4457]|uniref:twin-arginine translocation signal domain-containing protein n=1 Tax=Salmonella sp. SAL4457 TaxID=3159912 RepID=UPI00397D70B9